MSEPALTTLPFTRPTHCRRSSDVPSTSCTTAGRSVFPYVNCDNGVTISGAFAYRATALDASTVPLLTDSSGLILAATRAYGDGREALSLTQCMFETRRRIGYTSRVNETRVASVTPSVGSNFVIML